MSSKSLTRVSALIPVYNMPQMLPEAIESLSKSKGLGRDFELECIIIDDGSDNRIDFLASHETTPGFSIDHYRTQHKGKSAAINKGIDEATGEYLTIIDADDKLPFKSIALRIDVAKRTGADIVLGGFETFDRSGVINYRKPPLSASNNELITDILTKIKSPLHLNALLIKETLVNRVGSFDEHLLRGQDKDYTIRLLKEAADMEIIDEPVYQYRRYARGWSKQITNRLLTMKCKSRIMNKHTHGFKRVIYQGWSWAIEILKLGYEMIFGVYKK